ncbi:predicted protein [Arabidopsis lyrata subsp. lyrata]|uniref:Predicted protein n=1 Tax=Arabidopsis lyrata subsp. lyrata TaxID=81972 RepID=D7LQJ4_ARALL|nr:predicted protein [Arabidopsis lyrata subsp. lyrata]
MDARNDSMIENNGREVSDWSKLCPDLLRKIIESLNSIDYHRAKLVCSDWYSVWKTCVKRPLYPWRIIYYDDDSSSLFDPRENKIYETKLLGLSDNSYYMASSGNWLLMVHSRLDFYIFNLLTCEKINLPSMESSIRGGKVRFEPSSDCRQGKWGHLVDHFCKTPVSKDILGYKRSVVLWINERAGDYFVAWIFKNQYMFTHKKGDDSWWNWNNNWDTFLLDLAYKHNKLYLYTYHDSIKIIDFSGDSPKEEIKKKPVLGSSVSLPHFARGIYLEEENSHSEIRRGFGHLELNKRRAPVQDVGDGIKTGSICFVKDDVSPYYMCSNCGVFDLATNEFQIQFLLLDMFFIAGQGLSEVGQDSSGSAAAPFAATTAEVDGVWWVALFGEVVNGSSGGSELRWLVRVLGSEVRRVARSGFVVVEPAVGGASFLGDLCRAWCVGGRRVWSGTEISRLCSSSFEASTKLWS